MIFLILGGICFIISTIIASVILFLFLYCVIGIFLMLLGSLSEKLERAIDYLIISPFHRYDTQIFIIYLIAALFFSIYSSINIGIIVRNFIKNLF